MAALFRKDQGAGETPVVLLHGFGGSHAAWDATLAAVGDAPRTIAFDLPGHAGSLDHPHGGAGKAARSVLEALAARGISRAHLVGHSMGGAAAALAALMEPARAASLTLLAPGGFGPEANQMLLRRYASASGEAEITQVLGEFFAPGARLPAGLATRQAEDRSRAGAIAALQQIVESFFDGDAQKTLPVAELGRIEIPFSVMWGTEDRVLPAKQAEGLPATVVVQLVPGAGHMLPYEAPDEVARLILRNTARAA